MTEQARAERVDDPAATVDAFAAAWTVLSRLLIQAPTQDLIDTVRSEHMVDQWPLDTSHPANRRGIRLLARSRRAGETEAEVRRDVQRLFTGPGRLLAPPYESVHLNPSGLIFDSETLAVRAFYRRFGLRAPRLNQEPDDHIALELELLSTLAARALEGEAVDGPWADDSVTAIREFVSDHALPWHRRLGELTVEHGQTSFMQAVGNLLIATTDLAAAAFVPQTQEHGAQPSDQL